MGYFQRDTCRLCDGNLKEVLSLGEIHLSTFLDTNDNPPPKIPLDLMICEDCSLMQLHHTVSGEDMYSDYWYQSGLNGSMVRSLNDVVENVFKRVALNQGDIVVDIGSNDGTLLSFYPRYLTRVGYEPSNLYALAGGKADVIINGYFDAKAFKEKFGDKKAKAITAIAMFYDLEEPHVFVEDLKEILAPDGIIVIQMMDLMSMMKYGDFPNICHEHLEYYSLSIFDKLMLDHDLEVFDVEYNGVNGGSLRAYVRHISNDGTTTLDDGIFKVIDALIDERQFFEQIGDPAEYFKKRIQEVKEKAVGLIKFIKWACGDGQTVAVMGASTKGNTVLQFFGLTNKEIIHAAEINPDKYGKYTVGSNIPIISQELSLQHDPDYYLILPWGFINNFIDRNKPYLMNGGKFIVPLPEPRVIGMNKDGSLWTQPI